MDRRTFLKTTTAAAAASSTAAVAATPANGTPAVIGGDAELTFALLPDTAGPLLTDTSTRIAERLKQTFGARINVVAADDSAAEANLHIAVPDVQSNAAHAFFDGLPGSHGLAADAFQAWLSVGGGQMLWDDLAAHDGWKPLLVNHTGSQPGLWSNHPLTSPADLAGPSVAVGGLGARVLATLGAAPIHVPVTEVTALMNKGSLSAAEVGGPLAGLMLGLPQVASHYYLGGIYPAGHGTALYVRLDVWEKMSASDRAILEGIAAQELALSLAEARAHAQLARDAIAATPSLTIAPLPASLIAAVDASTADMLNEMTSQSLVASRIHHSYQAFRKTIGDTIERMRTIS